LSDLNRNYSYEWGGLGTSDSSGQTYPGTAGFSEPETQAIKWFCEEHEFVIALNNHTYSQLLLYPFGFDYDQPTPDDATFQTPERTPHYVACAQQALPEPMRCATEQ